MTVCKKEPQSGSASQSVCATHGISDQSSRDEGKDMKQQSSIIDLCDLHKYYGNLEVIKGVDISIAKGEVVVFWDQAAAGNPRCFAASIFLRSQHRERFCLTEFPLRSQV